MLINSTSNTHLSLRRISDFKFLFKTSKLLTIWIFSIKVKQLLLSTNSLIKQNQNSKQILDLKFLQIFKCRQQSLHLKITWMVNEIFKQLVLLKRLIGRIKMAKTTSLQLKIKANAAHVGLLQQTLILRVSLMFRKIRFSTIKCLSKS